MLSGPWPLARQRRSSGRREEPLREVLRVVAPLPRQVARCAVGLEVRRPGRRGADLLTSIVLVDHVGDDDIAEVGPAGPPGADATHREHRRLQLRDEACCHGGGGGLSHAARMDKGDLEAPPVLAAVGPHIVGPPRILEVTLHPRALGTIVDGAQRFRLAIGGRQYQHLHRVRAPGVHMDTLHGHASRESPDRGSW